MRTQGSKKRITTKLYSRIFWKIRQKLEKNFKQSSQGIFLLPREKIA